MRILEDKNKLRFLFVSILVLLDMAVAPRFIDYHNQFFDHELVYETSAFEADINRTINVTLERLSRLYSNSTITVNDKTCFDPIFGEYYSPPAWRTVWLPNGTPVNDYFIYFYRTGHRYVFNVVPTLVVMAVNFVLIVIIWNPEEFFRSKAVPPEYD